MKHYYIPILLVIFAGCGLSGDSGYRTSSPFYYPPVVEPASLSEFRFDYRDRSVNEQQYERIREAERRQTRINELERQNRGLRSRWPYQRYDPLNDLESSRPSSGYRRYNPLDDL